MSQSNQSGYGGGFGQMPSYGGMRGGGYGGGGPQQIGMPYRKPMMQPQQATRSPMPAYTGNPNDGLAMLQWNNQYNQQQPWSMYNGQQPQQQNYDPNPNISGTQAVPWYENYGFGPTPASTMTPGRYHGFAGAAFDDQGNTRTQPQGQNPFHYWMGQR